MNKEEIKFYVAECMEFFEMGEFVEDIPSIDEAVKVYNDMLNKTFGKGIGFTLYRDGKFFSQFDLLINDEIDIELILSMRDFADNKLVKEAIKEISKYFPDKVKK